MINENPSKKWNFIPCLLISLVTFGIYFQVRGFDFVNYDDNIYVYENPHIQDGLTLKSIKWAFISGYASNWHPLTWLSHILDWQLFGSKAGGHHFHNLILHIINALILFIVLKQMTSAIWRSAFVAFLFALHPLHVESVAWVSERKDLLSTLFWILTMWAYFGYVKRPGTLRYFLALFIFALGLTAKPMLVTLPFVLLLLDYWPLNRIPVELNRKKFNIHLHGRTYHRLILEKIPFIVLSAVSSTVTVIVQEIVSPIYIPLSVRISNSILSYVQYMRKMIWPSKLAVFYPYSEDISAPNVIFAALFLASITIAVLYFAKKYKYLLTGWFWYAGTLVPVIGLVQVGSQAMADRYSYVTLMGLFVMIAWGIQDLFDKLRIKKMIIFSSAVLVIALLGICTYFQIQKWQNNMTLFQHALNVTENNHIARLHIAKTFCDSGRIDEGVCQYRKYLQMKPNDADVISDLGVVLFRNGRFAEAAIEYKKYLRIKPDTVTVLNDLAVACSKMGQNEEAINYLGKALQIKPDFTGAHINLGYIFMLSQKPNEAIVHFSQALNYDSNSSIAHYRLANVFANAGRVEDAIEHYENAIRLKNKWPEPLNEAAWLLATNNKSENLNPQQAVTYAQRACEITNYIKPEMLDTLAAAYAACGDFSKALEVGKKAKELCVLQEQQNLKNEIQNRLNLYIKNKPFLEEK